MGIYAAVLIIISGLFLIHKSDNTLDKRRAICVAIYKYRRDCILSDKPALINFEDMEPFEATLLRVWDFGHENILPEEKYNLIKEYIK